jgi:glutamate racemase
MTQVDDDIKFGMIEAVSHLIHRDYEAIVQVSCNTISAYFAYELRNDLSHVLGRSIQSFDPQRP